MPRIGMLVCAALLGAVTACSTTEEADDTSSGNALSSETGIDWIVSTDAATGAIRFAMPKKGAYALPAGGALDAATLAFLADHKTTFKMQDPRNELVAERTSPGANGSTDVRFVQKKGGIPVYGANWIAHFDKAGRLTSMSGNYVVGASAVDTTPKLDAAGAKSAAMAAAARSASVAASVLVAKEPSLEIAAAPGKKPALAYAVAVSGRSNGRPIGLRMHVDASTGATLFEEETVDYATTTAKATQSHAPYNVPGPDLSFVVSDETPPRMSAANTHGVMIETHIWGGSNDVVIGTTDENGWFDPILPEGAPAAAQANAGTVLEYIFAHGFNSYDNNGGVLLSYVNDNDNGVGQAFWDGASMHYGDGVVSNLEWPTSASLDTVAHEIFHGVVDNTARLVGTRNSDMRALNESIADTFAAFVTHRIRNDESKDFTFCEDDNNANIPFRSMIDPTLAGLREDPGPGDMSQVSEKNKEEHQYSHIPSHAFYLITHGGIHATTRVKVPCGLGWDAADRLYWNTLTTQMGPNESFHDFALHLLASAGTLNLSKEPIVCAFVGAGVLTSEEGQNDWSVTCERDGQDGGTDGGDAGDGGSGNTLITQPSQLIECPAVQLTNGDSSSLLSQ